MAREQLCLHSSIIDHEVCTLKIMYINIVQIMTDSGRVCKNGLPEAKPSVTGHFYRPP